MPETWANIYIWVLIVGNSLGILLLYFRPLSRIFGNTKSDEYSRAIRRRLLIRECFQLIVGVIALVLFKEGILGGSGVLVFCTVLLICGVFLWRVKPVAKPSK